MIQIKRKIGYGRVSSREQAYDSQALQQQIARLKEAGATEIHQDVQSGKKDNRPALKEVMRLVKQGQVEEIIIIRLDRLARSLRKLHECFDLCVKHKVNLRVLDQQIDLSTSQGKLMANVLGALAQWETDLLAERVRHGKEYQRKQKQACESTPFGYQRVDGKYVFENTLLLCLLSDRPDNFRELAQAPVEALPGRKVHEVARDCLEIFLEVKGVRRAVKAILSKYGIKKTRAKVNGTDGVFHWSLAGFQKWIINPVLQGHTAYLKSEIDGQGNRVHYDPQDWQYAYDTHPEYRLVSNEEKHEIEDILELSKSPGSHCFHDPPKAGNRYRTYEYQRGLVFCAECGSKCIAKSYWYKKQNTNYYYYACRHAKIGCDNHKATRKATIEKAIITKLLEFSEKLSNPDEAPASAPPAKSERLQKLEAKLAKLGSIEDFDPEVEKLKEKTRQEIAEETNPFAFDAVDQRTVEEVIRAGNNLAIWQTLSADEKVTVYRKLIHKITIRNGEVESVVLKV